MSIFLPRELLQRTSMDSEDPLEGSPSDIPDGSFRDLLQVLPVDEKSQSREFFSNLEEENGEKEVLTSCVQFFSPPLDSMPNRKKEKEEALDLSFNPFIGISPIQPNISAFSVAVRNMLPSAEIEAIFEKMASQMIVMQSSGEVETTMFLDDSRFASSIFFGTKITIREFNTAPKVFNVEIASSTQGRLAIEASKNDLLAAFQNGNFNFSIHRLDTQIQNEDRPVLHRNENNDNGSSEEQKGGHEQ